MRYAETDQMGVVYHANYLVWLEVARTDLLRAQGLTYAELERQGYGLTVAEVGIRYRAPARYDDDVMIKATVADVRSRSLRIEYEVTRESDATILATAYTALVSIDPPSGKPVALPPSVQAILAQGESK